MIASAWRRRGFAAVMAAVLLAAAAVLRLCGTTGLSDVVMDARFGLTGRPASGQIVLVDIDEKSLAAIGVWPWPRSIHAGIIDALVEAGAKEVVFDVDFSSHSSEAEDAALADALARAPGNVTLAANRQRPSADTSELTLSVPLEPFARQAWLGLADVNASGDGMVRSVPLSAPSGDGRIASLSALLAGGVPTQDDGSFRIDFGIDARQIVHVSAIDVIQRRAPPGQLAGRKVIVGASSVVLKDYFAVPRFGIIQGSLVHALGGETLLQGRALRLPAPVVGAAVTGFLILLATLAALFMPGLGAAALAAGMSLVIEAAAIGLQSATPVALDTAGWHLLLAVMAGMCIAREVMERGRLWRAARREKQLAQAILDRVFDDSAAPMLIIDNFGRIRAASRAARQLLGAPDMIVGQPAADLLPTQLLSLLEAGGGDSGTLNIELSGAQTRIFEFTRSLSKLPAGMQAGGTDGQAICLTLNDVTERTRARESMERLARLDVLTQLPNRNSFLARLSAPAGPEERALILIDIDHFKVINEAMGHKWGNAALLHLARMIEAAVGPAAFTARIDGDEFAVLANAAEAGELAARIASFLEKPLDVRGRQAMLGASLGVAPLEAGMDADRAVRRAGLALAEAKAAGGRCVRHYSAGDEQKTAERAVLERQLGEALKQDEFCVFYQPQVDAATGQIIGAEALLRWLHPARGLVLPGEFIPLLEQTGLIGPVGRFVLRRACQDAASWPAPVRIAVNVAVPQLISGDFADTVATILAETQLTPGRLDLELTESLFIQNPNVVSKVLGDLRALGAGLALDDFGTGYSSLSYIKRFPVTKVKLDRAFIRDLPDSAESVAIVKAVSAIAGALDLKVVAEGVETPDQLRAVQMLGCHEVQGFLTGRPMLAREFAALLGDAGTERAAA